MDTPATIDLGLQTAALDRDLEFIYVGDPMCSWCWAFAPALEQLDARYTIPLRVVMGGLRTGAQADVMDAQARQHLDRYWQGVAERTGQAFTSAALERDGWRYDTEPSCRAVVAMRELSPRDTLRWVATLHRAFYVDGIDITDPSVFGNLLTGFDVDRAQFEGLLGDDATARLTQQDFVEAQRYGATGFPTVLFRDGDDLGVVTRGYVPWAQLEPALTEWLQDRYGPVTAGLVCDPTTGLC